ncbi:hypothetical protein Kpol_1002p93 [Vanderwaltozyma polyspora DSM 70294]|uniref:CUE domain-containing protein n=1 Tax=Vanderwaltozyma polyspora (strain ATCC 22028 / DSM 70294 / BCRC 21397 / CBS 2163 / NBRC 10782 / NRRL Y-8283 / UCD 57-17) TaxID=436907 RepID=A7TEC3_VANPO|nr:uncharacterized protein Kpol_1002p93 [Vanderwaltozyma polyspora DSM 70294]EDO19445.1 hypothetical protein Kpol_1002p93 [Vanderwaltozyma polyspora DSM 70294]
MVVDRIISFDGEVEDISFPIVKFPPIGLRALLIEKDPVVWAHILETYVAHLEFIMQGNNLERLSSSTMDSLLIFLRSYLHEMANDKGIIQSLGENNDVTKELELIRIWVFAMIKKCGLLHLQIFGETLWDMVTFYVEGNADTIRNLIDGSLKPEINTQRAQINRIHQVQQYIKQLVESGKFSRIDMKAFECLLSSNGKNRKTKFADEFMSTTWCESLESWWNKGKGRSSEVAQQLAVVTLLTSSSTGISKVVRELGVSDIDTLSLYPLLGSILMSEAYQQKVPDIKSKIYFLNVSTSNDSGMSTTNGAIDEVNEEDVNMLAELFPIFTHYQLSELLVRYDNNVELLTNILFENPSVADDIPKAATVVKPKQEPQDKAKMEDVIYPQVKKRNDKSFPKHVPDEVKNKTLTRALQLLYEDDEDEVDDTYEEAEVERSAVHGKVSIDDSNEKTESSVHDKIEGYLWNLLKEDPTLFERSKRKSKVRKDMKGATSWSDEQIEGWARMIEKSPKRAMILEEKFMFRGNKKSGKTSFVQNRDHNREDSNEKGTTRNTSGTQKKKNKQQQQQQQQQQKPESSSKSNDSTGKKKKYANNEKHKSSSANHNRKKGHDKKLSKVGI